MDRLGSKEPWFCLADVCKVLDIQNQRDVLAKQVDEKGVEKIYTPTKGGNQQLNYVNEPNLYRVIFRSNKPEAKQFQDWVFNEVLPAIRKTGSYQMPVDTSLLASANQLQQIKQLVHQISWNNPKAHPVTQPIIALPLNRAFLCVMNT